MKVPSFTIWKDKGRYGFTLWAGNGQQLAGSVRSYATASGARRACKAVNKCFTEWGKLDILNSISLGK